MTAAKKDPIEKFEQEVALGRFDGSIGRAIMALRRRVIETDADSVRWRFDLDGITFDEGDIDPLTALACERECGRPWYQMNFQRDADAQVALLRRILIKRGVANPDEWIGARSFAATINAFVEVDVP